MTKWVEFTPMYGGRIRIDATKVMAIHENYNGDDHEIKVVGREYKGPITYIEYGPTMVDEDGTGIRVRGSLDEVQAKLDGTYREEETPVG